uniref:Uncharacterized protein n=1 Tax=Globodera rostochiensis TaxID=31243 RepID=A0A914HRF9_GLORO
MQEFWILILVSFFATNSLEKAETVQLFDEIFGEGWWDKDKADEWDKLTLEQNFHYEIDRQNTQIGQIEPNSTDQNPPLAESDHSGQIEPNSIDQNPPLAESDQSGQIEPKMKYELEKFDQMKAELKRDGFKNAYHHQIDETVAKELGITYRTIYDWKRKLGQTTPNHNKYSHNEQKELLKRYYQINDKMPKISDANIAKRLKIDVSTLRRWKKLHPNVVDGLSVEENAAGSNVQEIVNSKLGSI